MALLGFWPPVAHLALVAACAATAWWRLETAPGVPDGVTGPADLAAPEPASALEAEDIGGRDRRGDVEAVAARALFRPGRLAAAEEGAAPAMADQAQLNAPGPPATLRMVGSFDQGGRLFAILETVEDGENHVVREGDEIAGARVQRITRRAVVIETDGGRIDVELYPE